jgi:hypothetical protein
MKPTIGVILSDTTFHRPIGDVGNPQSYSYPVIVCVARGVTAAEMVQPVPNMGLLEIYLHGALDLQQRGAGIVTTTCGFLVALQDPIAKRLNVPFVASSLLQVPAVSRIMGGRIGIITADEACLTREHLAAAGVTDDMPIAIRGLQDEKEFADPLLKGIGDMDLPKVERCVVAAARELLRIHPDIKAFVFECHNLPPFARAVGQATGKPVFDILSLIGGSLQALQGPRDR